MISLAVPASMGVPGRTPPSTVFSVCPQMGIGLQLTVEPSAGATHFLPSTEMGTGGAGGRTILFGLGSRYSVMRRMSVWRAIPRRLAALV